jgi:hypothetical protein
MTIDELIEKLKLVKAHSGNIEVRCITLTHSFPPDLLVKRGNDGKDYLILNN